VNRNSGSLPRLLVCLSLLSSACGTDAPGGGSVVPGHSRPVAVTLRGKVLYDGERLARPQVAAVAGARLVVTDAGGGDMLLILDRADGRVLRSWGRKGRGPGEFLSIWSVQPSRDPGQVWVFDPSQGRLTLVDVDALVSGKDHPVVRMLSLRSDLLPLDVRWISDTLLISTGLFRSGRVAVFDSTGAVRHFAGPLPPTRAGIPVNVAQHAYSGTLALRPSHGSFAIATRNADRIELYGSDGSLQHLARGPIGFEPQYELQYRGNQPSMATGDDLRFGYVDASAAGDRIFALYSGHTRAERPGRANFGDEVHVFDWDGNMRARYRLDHPALTIAVDAGSRTLYAVRHDPEPAIVSYPLPPEAFR
jgi:hypothetical protein